ncbi:hypothetical protein KIH74_09950 [Kineosporia sp. J2-2]|uniref:Beta-lactamase n=1 Tax=Kineosporia corallincola TaxID=2835133 RepID=A0ABS5TGP2_9ACTN|nr:penicillin-binding transpeptidase domain-containing protein [Kineosporia corallincola]MBT0769243.1 hypothetical protein [Kineosporia corallincola]
MNRRVLIYVLVAVLVVAGAGGAALYLLRDQDHSAAQKTAAEAFGRAWTGGTLGSLGFATGKAKDPAGSIQTLTAGLTSEKTDKPTAVTVGEPAQAEDGTTATVPLHVTWTLAGDQKWEYDTTLTLAEQEDAWLPQYSSSLVHPDLTGEYAGATLEADTLTGSRGRILGADDKVLVEDRDVVVVGIQKSAADNVENSVNQVASVVGVDGAALLKRVKAASADTFVDAITLRKAAYDQLKSKLQPISGAVFQEKQLSLAPTSDFARPLIGTVGAATADIVEESGGRVQAGDETGLSGLQRTYDEQLSGTPGVVVTAVPAKGAGADPGKELYRAEAAAGEDLKITLDEDIQKAADKALATSKKLAGMVAIDTNTGNVLAIANGGGSNGNSYNRALLGQYPPGSTFKIASTLGLLEYGGMTADKTVNCPKTISVGGRTFSNSEDEEFGAVKFSVDFAHSCNTAFVGSAKLIDQGELAKAAKSIGYGQPNATGVTAFLGSVPTDGDAVEHAASMIGQSKVLASPLAVAGASAAVASGTYHAPTLVLNGTTGDDSTDDEDADDSADDSGSSTGSASAAVGSVDDVKLDATAVKTLRSLMRGVVTNGTATALKNVPGGAVAGKTGTAEFGSDNPPKTHAWFTGYQGDIAFAVVVEDGGFGAETAVPLVKKFLTDLAS